MVLPAPFWPTIASDVPAGNRQIEAIQHLFARGGIGEGEVPKTHLARRHALAACEPRGNDPAGPIASRDAASPRPAPRRRERPRQAAERDHARGDGRGGEGRHPVERERAVRPRRRQAARTPELAASTRSRLQARGRSRRRVAFH